MRPLLNYYGGKWNAGSWVISQFPDHGIYVEAFGGGASVLLQKPRSKREVLNDIDDEIYNLYWVLRNKPKSLKRRCLLTAHSRSEYDNAFSPSKNRVEQARRTIIKSYFGIGDSVFNKNGMRFSKKLNTCVATSWKNWNQQIDQILERFQGVTIEKLDYRSLIKKYDSPSTLFYLDPPYVKETRNAKHAYRHDFETIDHEDLIEAIQNVTGMLVLSGYDHPIYNGLNWKKIQKEFKTQKKTNKTETIWMNPSCEKAEVQMDFIRGQVC